MSITLNADTSSGLVMTSDTSGEIKLQSAGADIATVDSSGITMASGKSLSGDASSLTDIPGSALTGDVFVTDATQSELVYSTNGVDSPGKIYYNHSVGQMYFETDGSYKMKIHDNGNIAWATEGSAGFQYNVDADPGRPYFKNWVNSTATKNQFTFNNPNGEVGRITTASSSTSYLTSSDYRLKENNVLINDGITRVKLLKPYRFNFITDADNTVDGFFAHEVQSVVPEAIAGTHNEVDDEGNPVYQGIDQAKLVPLLTAALQEAITKIEDLETRISTLESA
jgi:hypothetical protein